RLRRIDHQVVAFEVEEAVPLGGDPPLALQPAGPARRPVTQPCLAAPRSLVVVAHLPGADAPDVEVLVQIRMLHDVDVADLLVAAHLAGGVIGFVCRRNTEPNPRSIPEPDSNALALRAWIRRLADWSSTGRISSC